MSGAPKSTLAGYSQGEVDAIVAVRCAELSTHLGWMLVPPAVRLVDPIELSSSVRSDVDARGLKIRGSARHEGCWSGLAASVLQLFGPSVLGYFAAGSDTLFLNRELVPAQAGYVLLHELTHAAQWQRSPALFAAIDAARVAAEDAQDRVGDAATEAQVARDRYESLVTFVEGHATFHGRRACEGRLLRDAPNTTPAEVEAFVDQLVGLDLTDETTQLIYVRGEATIALLPHAARVDELFHDPEAIVTLLTRRKAA